MQTHSEFMEGHFGDMEAQPRALETYLRTLETQFFAVETNFNVFKAHSGARKAKYAHSGAARLILEPVLLNSRSVCLILGICGSF